MAITLNVEELRSHFHHSLIENEPREWPANMRQLFREGILASLISGRVLGNEWFERTLASESRPMYFRGHGDETSVYARAFKRRSELGEMIFNLKDVENFRERMNDLETTIRRVETKVSELMGGRYFKQIGMKFDFRIAQGSKQYDYDIDYIKVDGTLGRCEIKSKELGTVFSQQTIENSLKKAKNQLPKDKSSLVMLRIPEEWVPIENSVSCFRTITEIVKNWLRASNTSRISSVLLFDSRVDEVDTGVVQSCYYHDIENPGRVEDSGLPVCKESDYYQLAPSRQNWITIPEIIEEWPECSVLNS